MFRRPQSRRIPAGRLVHAGLRAMFDVAALSTGRYPTGILTFQSELRQRHVRLSQTGVALLC
jgi:hypothetical protein